MTGAPLRDLTAQHCHLAAEYRLRLRLARLHGDLPLVRGIWLAESVDLAAEARKLADDALATSGTHRELADAWLAGIRARHGWTA